MRIFAWELKKIWNWRVLLLIAALFTLAYITMLYPSLEGNYNSVAFTGKFTLEEMYDKYGDTLEPEEWADFNIEARYAEVNARLDKAIIGDPLFAKYEIFSAADAEKINTSYDTWSKEKLEQFHNIDQPAMLEKLYAAGGSYYNYYTAYDMLQELTFIEAMFTETNLSWYYDARRNFRDDERPVVRRLAEEYMASYNNNLIRRDITRNFSSVAAGAAVLAVVAVLVLTAPMLTTDRSRGIHYLQYASKTGRKLFRTQLLATIVSAAGIGLLLIAAAYFITFAITDMSKYLHAHIAGYDSWMFYMYNPTLLQYALLLGGITLAFCIGAACLAFILARYSANIVPMMIKSTPAAITLGVLAVYTANQALSSNNAVFNVVFRGAVLYSEAIFAAGITLIGLVAAAVVVLREKRADVA